MEKQVQTQRQLLRFLDNFKKLGRTRYTPALVRSRMTNLNDLWQHYNEGHAMLEAAMPKEARGNVSYFADDYYGIAEDAFNNTLDHMAEVLEELEPRIGSSRSVGAARPPASSTANSATPLPVIQLTPFDGKIADWEAFRDRFTAVIIDNPNLTDYSRIHYLMSFLRGGALECLSGLAERAENFTVAWALLKKRYDNKRRLISNHLANLLALTPLRKGSASDLQSLFSRFKVTVASLDQLQRAPQDLWNDILVHLAVRNFDATTHLAWSLHATDGSELPTFARLEEFVFDRIRVLEEASREPPCETGTRASRAPRVHNASISPSPNPVCPICNARHFFPSCSRFKEGSVNQRRDFVVKHGRCFNCLSPKHTVRDCPSKHSCRQCHQRHHTLLHVAATIETRPVEVAAPVTSVKVDGRSDELHALAASTSAPRRVPVMLATARVRVRSSQDRTAVVRALLDQGSEVTLISERLAQTLRAKRLRTGTFIRAVGGIVTGPIRCAVGLRISSPSSPSPSFDATAVVLKSLTSYAPRYSFDVSKCEYLRGLDWADPEPFAQDPIEIIIGSDLYGALLCEGVRRGGVGRPIAQKTVFGWIVSGPIHNAGAMQISMTPRSESRVADVASACHCIETLQDDLRRFWEIESVPDSPPRAPDDERCEAHFMATHSRAPDGRYCVRLPVKGQGILSLGSSRTRAARSLESLCRRLRLNPEHQQTYSNFLREYELLGHMKRVTNSDQAHRPIVYLPHHPVFRNPKSSVGMRVVFNASSVTSDGTSLNDHLLIGPRLQTDIIAVISRWRNFKFVYCADIAKMYRQIRLDPRDADHQRILWSNDHPDAPDEYRLLTVTYGMACAPFLALRVLQQLRHDEGSDFPMASDILERNIYVDDVLFGGDTQAEALCARDQLISLLSKGCFPLRKWSSNANALLSDIPEAHRGQTGVCDIARCDAISVLGLAWFPAADVFSFNVILPDRLPATKRGILQFIAKLFDPLGWIAPVTIVAKILIQSLWRHHLDWDDALPPPLLHSWTRTFQGLPSLSSVRVPRWTGFVKSDAQIELHGFADASNSAYAAVVYCKVSNGAGLPTISLVFSKTKVAPIKPLSVPRLELCAALILSRLIAYARNSLSLPHAKCYCWSDSSVVLAWLSRHPSTWKVFVAHRVHEIQTLLPDVQWRHVPSADNPADCASRGLSGGELLAHPLWWCGPPWLAGSDESWPTTVSHRADDLDLERRIASFHVESVPSAIDLFERFSSWPRLIRVFAYIFRFIAACRRAPVQRSSPCVSGRSLSFEECRVSRLHILRRLQVTLFPSEIRLLQRQQPLPSRTSILTLSPFLDKDGILRVGGRLSRAPFPFSRSHPILLSQHPITTLIVDQAHVRALHGGIQLTLSVLRRDFWILRARSMVRRRVHTCVTCARERASTATQFMSDLPAQRVSAPSRAFLHVGVDYAGPMTVRSSAGRGGKMKKAYIALFVCLASRAIHLELVSDCSSPTFVNAFSRFTARRGLPDTVYSDNGTTFTGADRELTTAFRAAIRDPDLLNHLASDEIRWKFIPPSAPHFGGLWEAGVKSVKHHLRRVTKGHCLTSEELSTLLCRVEACVNSRPIAPLSDNLDDYEPLTPGHFLIGSALTAHPEPSLLDVNENRLSRWQMVRQMTERFWHYWSSDYLNSLQQRRKWKSVQPPLKPGRLVLIRNSTLPPCKWDLGRVTQCHPGQDGLIRVVTVKTATSELVRPIVQLCLLPVDCASAAGPIEPVKAN